MPFIFNHVFKINYFVFRISYTVEQMMLADDRKVIHQAIHTDTVNSQERNVVLDDRPSTMNYSERTYVYCVKIFAHIKCYSVRSRRGHRMGSPLLRFYLMPVVPSL